MKKSLFFCLIFLSLWAAQAQKINFLKAQEQHWVGGVCCSYGINYHFYFESTDTIHFIHIDSVWIGDRLFVEGEKNSLTNFKNVRKGKTTYHITAASIWNSALNKGEEIVELDPAIHPPHYKGKACLVYYADKQRKIIPVPEFMKLGTIAYP